MIVHTGMEQVGRTKLHKTKRNNGLLCSVLKVISYDLYTFSLLMKFPYYVL